MSLNDFQLVDEIRAGSQAAFDQLIRRHEQFVYRVAFAYTRDADAALDVSQNVFIKVHTHLESFHGRSSFRAWLTRIAQNESLSWVRGRKSTLEVTVLNAPSCAPVQEKDVVRAERSRDLLAEVHRLNPSQRQAVLLRYFEKMRVREISEVLECSEGQVKSLLFRSLQKLRKHLSEQGRWDRELEA